MKVSVTVPGQIAFPPHTELVRGSDIVVFPDANVRWNEDGSLAVFGADWRVRLPAGAWTAAVVEDATGVGD